MIFRVAAGLARNPAPEHRWRRVVVPVSVALFMLMVLAGISVVAMVHREAHREAGRAALLASEPSPTDLFLARGYDTWRGEQYAVFWIEPAGSAESVLPPGMSRLPEPGKAAVSPGLDRMASSDPDLAKRYRDRMVLGSEGIRSEDELFAYVRMPEGRSLAGNEAAVRARVFGSSAAGRSFPLVLESSTVTVTSVIEGVSGFLVLPGFIVLAAGLASASSIRDHRFEVLRSIGAPGRTLAVLTVLETAFLAVPGLVAATVVWATIAPRLEQVPLVGHDVVRGDLGLPWWLIAAGLGAGGAAICAVAVLVTPVRRGRGTRGPRPTSRKVGVSRLRAAPLVLAIVAFLLGRILHGPLAANLNVAAIIAAIGGVPLILPGVLRAVGAKLGRLESVSASVAGRGIQWDPIRATRPFVGSAALIVIALASSGYIALAREVEATPAPAAGSQVITVAWLDPRPADTTRLADALGMGSVIPTREDGDALVVGATCRRLATYFAGTKCDPNSPFELPTETARRLAGRSLGYPGAKIRLVPGKEVATSGSALVLSDAPFNVLDERVRAAAMRTLPVPFVWSVASAVMNESPLVPWIVCGILVAAIVLTVGCLFSLVDRLLAARRHHRHLLNLGVVPRRLTSLEAWLFAVPYVVIATVSFLAGLMICAIIVGVSSDIPMPWRHVAVILGIVVVVGLVGTASVALFGARNVQTNPE